MLPSLGNNSLAWWRWTYRKDDEAPRFTPDQAMVARPQPVLARLGQLQHTVLQVAGDLLVAADVEGIGPVVGSGRPRTA